MNSFAVYPEVLAGLAVLMAVTLATVARRSAISGQAGAGIMGDSPRPESALRWPACGCVISTLPWLSSKYAPMAGALVLVSLGRVWWGSTNPPVRARLVRSAALLLPVAVSGVAWMAFFMAYWGSPWPSAPYGSNSWTHPGYLLRGGPGLLFDQEYGIFAYAPVLGLALTGLGAMFVRGGAARRLALELTLVLLALLCTVGAFNLWWGGSSPPGRPLISGLLLLAVPIAWRHGDVSNQPTRTAVHWLLLLGGLAVTGALVLGHEGQLIANDRDGASDLLVWLAPLIPAWTAMPSFITQTPLEAASVTIWVVLIIGVGLGFGARLLDRHGANESPARTGCRVTLVTVAGMLALAVAGSGTFAAVGSPIAVTQHLEERRVQIDLLMRYDAARLPLALVYDPWRRVPPAELPKRTAFRLQARAEAAEPPLMPNPYDRRVALAAGRYLVRLEVDSGLGPPVEGALSVHTHRRGPPFARWPVSSDTRSGWFREIDLPVDAGYFAVGLAPELAASRPIVWIEPLWIVDKGRRPQLGRTASAAQYERGVVYFLDRAACTAPGFLDSGLTVFASTLPRPARRGRVAPGRGFDSRISPASTVRCMSA